MPRTRRARGKGFPRVWVGAREDSRTSAVPVAPGWMREGVLAPAWARWDRTSTGVISCSRVWQSFLAARQSGSIIAGVIARLHSAAFVGIEAMATEVEVDVVDRGFSAVNIVGLPDAACKESIERVRSALANSGYTFPRYKTTISLAPADVRKEGPAFDLPIALGTIFASGEVVPEQTEQYLIMGELALDGRVRAVRGCLSATMLAKQNGFRGVLMPQANAAEAAVV